jgi:hypothetical protein
MLMPAHPNSTRRTAAGRSADPAGRLGSHGRLAGRRHHRRRRDRRSPGAGGRLGPAGAAGWACRRGGGRLAAGFCVPRDTRVARRRQGRAGRRWHAPPAAPARLGRGDAIPHGIPPCSVEPGPGGRRAAHLRSEAGRGHAPFPAPYCAPWPSTAGSRRAATGARRDPKTCRETVTDYDRRFQPARLSHLGFLIGSHGPQCLGIPPRNWSVGSDTEEVTGSNPVAPTITLLTSGNAAAPFPAPDRGGIEST